MQVGNLNLKFSSLKLNQAKFILIAQRTCFQCHIATRTQNQINTLIRLPPLEIQLIEKGFYLEGQRGITQNYNQQKEAQKNEKSTVK